MDGTAAPVVVVDDGRPGAVRLVGELDLAGVPVVQARLEGLNGNVELDCSGLTFIDSSGLGLFVAVHRACRARGAELMIVDPSPRVTQLLELTGLDTVLAVRRNGTAR
jgi:anti-sigma B factor antagonist